MVLELLLEETDELVEIALGQVISDGIDLSRASVTLTPGMLSALDEMRQEFTDVHQEDEKQVDLLIQTGAAATLSLTAGFVTWLLRTGSLLATLLSTSPLWRPFDPIPVLAAFEASAPEGNNDKQPEPTPEDEDDLANAVLKLMKDKDKRVTLGKALQNTVRDYYTSSRMARDYMRIYDEI